METAEGDVGTREGAELIGQAVTRAPRGLLDRVTQFEQPSLGKAIEERLPVSEVPCGRAVTDAERPGQLSE